MGSFQNLVVVKPSVSISPFNCTSSLLSCHSPMRWKFSEKMRVLCTHLQLSKANAKGETIESGDISQTYPYPSLTLSLTVTRRTTWDFMPPCEADGWNNLFAPFSDRNDMFLRSFQRSNNCMGILWPKLKDFQVCQTLMELQRWWVINPKPFSIFIVDLTRFYACLISTCQSNYLFCIVLPFFAFNVNLLWCFDCSL